MVVTFPRIVLSEFNTHRMFSRNSASSRAIPVQKQLERIRENPFIPTYWGAAQKGMQAHGELTPAHQQEARKAWLVARDEAVKQVELMLDIGLHKQLTNRILEPFMWHTVIVTATEWSNFFALRVNPDAQPEIRTIAEMMLSAYRSSTPTLVREGQWHLPLVQPDEYDGAFELSDVARRVSAARCARVSYLTHDGRRDHSADLTLYDRLVSGGHMSPLEHVARPMSSAEQTVSWRIDQTIRHVGREQGLDEQAIWTMQEATTFSGNFRGWVQLRKTVAGEHNFGLCEKESN
nr:Thymidylate synthase complementing protein [uncultured bacterium]